MCPQDDMCYRLSPQFRATERKWNLEEMVFTRRTEAVEDMPMEGTLGYGVPVLSHSLIPQG